MLGFREVTCKAAVWPHILGMREGGQEAARRPRLVAATSESAPSRAGIVR